MAGIGFDLAPTEQLDLGLEYTYTRDDYDDTDIGLQKETRHEACLDLSYTLPRGVILGASAGYERVVSDQRERQYSPGNNTNPDLGRTPRRRSTGRRACGATTGRTGSRRRSRW